MIEDKTYGLKIAEDKDEAFWTRVKNNIENEIKNLEDALKLNKGILEMSLQKLKIWGVNEEGVEESFNI